MLLNFLYMRIKQVLREFQALGFGRSIFLLVLLVFAQSFIIEAVQNYPYFSILFGMIPLSFHLKRNDHAFLSVHVPESYQIYLVEYFILSLPLLIPFLVFGQFMMVGAYGLFLCLLPCMPHSLTTPISFERLIQIVPDHTFEWKSGLRKTSGFVLAVWLLGFSTSWVIGSVPVALFLLGIMPISFYERGEPLMMIIGYEKPAGHFLGHKIKEHIEIFTWLSLPLVGAFVFFHNAYWYIVLIEWGLLLNLHLYCILLKYAFYQPNVKSSATQMLAVLGFLGVLVPIFLPLVWLLAIKFYKKAYRHLKAYLYDFH